MRELTTPQKVYQDKWGPVDKIFKHIHRGGRIFIGTGCGEPQYLVRALIDYVESHPKATFDTQVLHVWTLGVAPYIDEKFKHNFRYNSFFISESTRDAINNGHADYTPIFLSQVPKLLHRGLVQIDVALVQVSPPDNYGYMTLGISVDITKAAVKNAQLVVAQVNSNMPRVHGEGFIHIDDVDFIVPHDEPLLEYQPQVSDDIAQRIGQYVARLIHDGDTIQVGYGSIPNAILSNLHGKRHLGVHTELLTDGVVNLMRAGVIDNTQKSIDPGKTVATFCMGTQETYEYIHDNPIVEFHTIDHTNNPLIIAQHHNMTAINSALEIDLTGQATAESIGSSFYSGIGGQADFMRGATWAHNGKNILVLPSTAENGDVSRIVPFLREGAGATLNRGDVQYVVTEYGIAYLLGKNIRERAMALISIAHPQFKPWLIEEAKRLNLVYQDQLFIPGENGQYPEDLETYRTTKTGLEIFLRPVKITDEPLLKDFFYSLSDESLYRRFLSVRQDMPHERLQEFVIIDYTKEMAILAVIEQGGKEQVVGLGQYSLDESTHTAEAAFVVRDAYQNKGIGTELISYLTYLGNRQGLVGCIAEVLMQNKPMLHLLDKMGFNVERKRYGEVYELKLKFNQVEPN
jgi:acyl-CoA hydrolase/GNAT superfamily N-acetyltransferase